MLRYLFQSCVKASDGGIFGDRLFAGPPMTGGGPWMGIKETRWLEADAGVRRSNIRRWESEDTEEIIDGEWGEKAVLYVQECVGSVRIEA